MAGLQNIFILAVVLDLDDDDVNKLYSATKIYLPKEKDIFSSGLILLGIIWILRADPKNNSFRWVWTVHIWVPPNIEHENQILLLFCQLFKILEMCFLYIFQCPECFEM